MLQLANKTHYLATMAVLPNEDAIDTLYIVVKAAFKMGVTATPADQQTAPMSGDVYWSEPKEHNGMNA